MRKNIVKAVAFVALLAVLFLELGKLMQPVWNDWNNYNTVYGFYKEPKNSIQAVFVGTSVVVNCITPMEIYEEYGISSYNLATVQQPVIASLAWVKEAYRLNPDSLQTVVFDVSALRKSINDSYLRKGLDGMQSLPIKYETVRAYTGNMKDSIEYLFPALAYHSRWDSLNETDFEKYYVEPKHYLRGYNFTTNQKWFTDSSYEKITAPAYYVNTKATPSKLNKEAVDAFLDMVQFCLENRIKLVLVKFPVIDSWSSEDHNAVVQMLKKYGLEDMELLDMNYQPLLGETDYNHYLDSTDGRHVNYWGAKKISHWMGEYLADYCIDVDDYPVTDKTWIEQELQDYKSTILATELRNITDPSEYLKSVFAQKKYLVTISVSGNAASALTEEQKESFSSLGLEQLAILENGDTYVAVIDGNEVLFEQRKSADHGESDEAEVPDRDVQYKAILEEGTNVYVFSGLRDNKVASSCFVNGEELSGNKRGLNIVVYDSNIKQRVDTTVFDTYASSERKAVNWEEQLETALANNIPMEECSNEVQKLFQYRIKCQDRNITDQIEYEITSLDLLSYLKMMSGQQGYTLIMCVQDEASRKLTDNLREDIRSLGLTELAEIGYRDSYIAVIRDGEIYEDLGDSKAPCTYEDDVVHVTSAGFLCGNMSSCVINGEEYSAGRTGINVIIYNNYSNTVIDSRNFNTYRNKMYGLQ